MLATGGIGLELNVNEEFAEKKLAAHARDDELMVLADEAETGLHGPIAFEDGGAVGEGTKSPLPSSPLGEALCEVGASPQGGSEGG